MTKRDLVDGKCPNHQTVPEEVKEENWFFLLRRHDKDLKKLLTGDWEGEQYRILPSFREKETLSLIEQGLEDVSFSRPKTSLSWGVPVPGDEAQTMYVWCDALTNYISGLGYFTDHEERAWWDDAEVTHVIGKDIARFHALIWPAMLRQAGVRIPDRLLIHGFLTSEGQKMSKSLGNVVVPQDVIDKFGVDPLRFYLMHEVPVGNDGDFSWDRFEKLYDSKLRNDLGNLLNRVIVMLQKEGGELVEPQMPDFVKGRGEAYITAMNDFMLSEALQITMAVATECNKYIDAQKPWGLPKEEKLQVLSQLAEALRHISLMLLPFIPETAQRIATQLGVPYAATMSGKGFTITSELVSWGSQKNWKSVGEPAILFPPLS